MPIDISPLLPYLDKGGSTFIAACIAATVSVITLIISIFSARSQAKLANSLTDATNINKEAREYRLEQLTTFYDPIYTLLIANQNIFDRIGPASKARTERQFSEAETAEVWKALANEVIVPNNIRVCEIIQGNLHFISEDDDEKLYLEFLTHAHAYSVFKKDAYEAYALFPYPKSFLPSVGEARANIRRNLLKQYSK